MLLPDERSAAADALAGRLLDGAASVPAIWPLEVRNALLAALRSRRITSADFAGCLAIIDLLPVEVEPPPDKPALHRTVTLARRLGLSLYDATYLDLARQRTLPLATLDARLRKACASQRIAVLPQASHTD